ncbi:MAG: SDR family oxidoreductase [Chloroflexota bacterium]
MDLGLDNKTVLVAAASEGLGAAVAHRFGQEGANLVICSRDPERVEARAADIMRFTGARVLPMTVDVTDRIQIQQMVDATVEEFGKIDILITNAGGPRPGSFLDLAHDDFENAFQLTLMSAVNLCYAVVPVMLEQGGGSIVTITSVSVKQPIDNLTLSNSVRMAVVGLTKTLANELGPKGIRVNTVLPGWTRTGRVDELLQARARKSGKSVEEEMQMIAGAFPLGRMAEPDEFARATVFIASPAASYIHGVALPVDGGSIQSSL